VESRKLWKEEGMNKGIVSKEGGTNMGKVAWE
jgi:hypothetical protein